MSSTATAVYSEAIDDVFDGTEHGVKITRNHKSVDLAIEGGSRFGCVVLEYRHGVPWLVVYANLGIEEPTHQICLKNAVV